MKIISFNVNGIRAAIKKGLLEWLEEEKPDILCLQEIKLFETELVEDLFKILGFHCYWYPAQKKGYSGVAILSKIEPKQVSYGIGVEQFDFEGRVIKADFGDFSLICAYFPSGTTGGIRQDLKIRFLDHMMSYMKELKKIKSNLVLCGDINICHTEIDIHNPKSNKNSSGFLPEERAWVGEFLDSGYLDTFRHFNKDPHNYSWWSYRAGARSKNLGWRIDYLFTTSEMENLLVHADILPEVVMSDHCPVMLEINVSC
ncbi:MAG: exodeoxyribonuclease-3 [Arcticibacterium sp.]|jgi:exodeoxyribonuclease-3